MSYRSEYTRLTSRRIRYTCATHRARSLVFLSTNVGCTWLVHTLERGVYGHACMCSSTSSSWKPDGVFVFAPGSYKPDSGVAATGEAFVWRARSPRYARSSGEEPLGYVSHPALCLDSNLWGPYEISFGSIFWPAKFPKKIWAFVASSLAQHFPSYVADHRECVIFSAGVS